MAEAILREKAGDAVEVKSAGVFAAEGSRASGQALQVLKEKGIEHEHRASLLSDETLRWADYVFTMTESHKALILDARPWAADKTFTLKEFAEGGENGRDVTDPFGGSVSVYRETYKELEELIKKMLKQLET